MSEILIKNAREEIEPFDAKKLRHSLKRARATPSMIDGIVAHIESELVEGMTTQEIYHHAFSLLVRGGEHPVAARYSLRRALAELGPSGFPFESYLSELLKHQGYTTQIGVTLRGKCIEHEIDVVAQKDGEFAVVEAKFHNEYGYKTDVKVALYIKARFDDLLGTQFDGRLPKGVMPRGMLITNTKFTRSATAYGECAGISLIGWGYPDRGNLEDLIEYAALHPLSILTTLTHQEKNTLYERGIVLCKSVIENKDLLRGAGVSEAKIPTIIDEAMRMCASS